MTRNQWIAVLTFTVLLTLAVSGAVHYDQISRAEIPPIAYKEPPPPSSLAEIGAFAALVGVKWAEYSILGMKGTQG